MLKIKVFLRSVWKSLSSFGYYGELINTRLGFSIKYFLLLGALTAFLSTAAFGIKELPKMQNDVNSVLDQGGTFLPENFVLEAKGGVVKVNQPEPFIIPMPKYILEVQDKDLPADAKYPARIKNFVVFDSNGTVPDLEKYETMFLVNSANILGMSANGVEANSTKELPDNKFTNQDLKNFIGSVKSLSKVIPVLVLVAAFLLSLIGFYFFRSLYVLIVTTIFWVSGKLLSFPLSYSKFMSIAIHAMTLPIVAGAATDLVGLEIPFAGWFLIVHLLFGVVIIMKLKKTVGSELKL